MIRFSHAVSQNRFFTFLIGTLLLQASVLLSAAYLKSGQSTTHSSSGSTLQVSSKENSFSNDPSKASLSPDSKVSKDPALDQPRELTYKVVAGDTLTKIWIKNGAGVSGGVKAAEAFEKAGVPLSSLKLGDEVKLVISPQKDIIKFEKKLSEGKSISLVGNSTDGYKAEVESATIIEEEKTVSYPIFNSFSESAREATVPIEIIDDLVDLFSGRLNFSRDVQPGDSFTVIYTARRTESGESLRPGLIKAVSIENNGKLLVAMGHAGKDGKVRFFDESGKIIGDYFLRYPLKFTRISSVFSKSRFHPVLGTNRPHNGVDFAAPTGTPVRAVADGIITSAGYSGGSGNMIKIRHDDQYSTAYLHLSKINSGIKSGARVQRGQLIGAVGMTGLATGPHLHFSLYKDERFVDPLSAKLPTAPASQHQIPSSYVVATMKTLQQQHQMVRLAMSLGLSKEPRV